MDDRITLRLSGPDRAAIDALRRPTPGGAEPRESVSAVIRRLIREAARDRKRRA